MRQSYPQLYLRSDRECLRRSFTSSFNLVSKSPCRSLSLICSKGFLNKYVSKLWISGNGTENARFCIVFPPACMSVPLTFDNAFLLVDSLDLISPFGGESLNEASFDFLLLIPKYVFP